MSSLCLLALVAFGLQNFAANAQVAPPIVVNSTFDGQFAGDTNPGDGLCDYDAGTPGEQCTLRAAIQEASALPGARTITFDPAVFATPTTIVVSWESLSPANGTTLTIDGGANKVTIASMYSGHRQFALGTGFAPGANLTLNNLSINNGGGIVVGRFCTLTVNNALFAGNSGAPGSGIFNSGTLTVNNSTFSENNAAVVFPGFDGGAIHNGGIATVKNSMFVLNQAHRGPAIYNHPDGTISLGNSYVGLNHAGFGMPLFGTVTSLGYNAIRDSFLDLIGDLTGNFRLMDHLYQYYPLADNGGPTRTHALTPTSGLLDKGTSSFGPAFDQRGFPRPYDDPAVPNAAGGDGADIGPFETQSVTPPENLAPQIACSSAATFDCAPASGLAMQVHAAVTDPDVSQSLTVTLQEGATTLDTQTLASPAASALVTFNSVVLSPGAHALTVTVSDGTDTASCSTTVTVNADLAPPEVVSSLPNITMECPGTPAISTPVFNDTCDANLTVTSMDTALPTSGQEISKTQRTWTATDGAGNSVHCSQTITVRDTLPPVPNLAALPDVIGQCSATRPAAPTATDACDGPMTATTTAPATFGPGDFTIVWTYTDTKGNSVTQNQLVKVKDSLPPVPNLASLPDVTGQCSAVRPAAPTATDACDGPITATTTAPATFGPGEFTIVWTYTDTKGNSVTQNQLVKVKDTQSPVLSGVPANITVTATSASGATVNYSAATASDTCGPVTISYSRTSGSVFPVGTTTVTCTATDAVGNQATASFTVTVKAQATAPSALAQLDALIATVNNLPVNKTVKTALQVNLTVAKTALALGQKKLASDTMKIFEGVVDGLLKTKQLTAAQATQLKTASVNIRTAIGTP